MNVKMNGRGDLAAPAMPQQAAPQTATDAANFFFDYDLPPALIAQHPTTPREQGRLLLYRDGVYDDHVVGDLPQLLPDNSVVVFNNSRVIPAKLTGRIARAKAERIIDVNLVRAEKIGERFLWQAMVRGLKKIAVGDDINFAPGGDVTGNAAQNFTARVVEKLPSGLAKLEFHDQKNFWHNLEQHGQMPIPPYLKRSPDDADKLDYQTIFAEKNGSVASPTASLHFTEKLKQQLLARGIMFLPVTLHVGLGTFLPIKGDIKDHVMHQEWGVIDADTVAQYNRARAEGKKIIALGTTSLRLLESAIDKDGRLRPFDGATDIFIKPPYRVTSADYLLTNFHLPHSTLLLLVNSFIGAGATKKLYETAIARGYRFYSYGDACLLKQP
ncbi:MAG: tRNA preQ1(34) S-adenosylmethionine ribosyltransferase-isomerase QueA [Hydrotalea sp.]|nr:tRNA preQ1(34) S-adenosylmethionine ribosyltransferase-isomerase QueA [Hydrotalea sp.]